MPRQSIDYAPSPTGWKFHQSDAFVRALMGPVGSGKSVACCNEIFKKANEAEHSSKWAIVRNTYRELEDTTLATWMDWFAPFGEFKYRDMSHTIRLPHDRELVVLFRALDKPSDIGKLLSLELTGGWINEAREVPLPILQNLIPRVLRYPSAKVAPDAWHGVIMDTNPPDDLHWWYKIFEEDRPDTWTLFKQPGGREPDAENIANLVPGYYDIISKGQDQAWQDVYVNGNYGFLMDGKPVYPEYNDGIHCAQESLALVPDARHVVGLDFGLTPAACFWQQTSTGQWQAIHEIVTQDMAAFEFADVLGAHIRKVYKGLDIEIYGDPAGEQRAQTDAKTPFQILRNKGINAVPAMTNNDERIRHDSVAQNMRRMTMDGGPGVIISPDCKYLRRGFAGGYKYRLLQVSGGDKFHEKPEKNIYSHICEAAEYGLVGGGEGRALLHSHKDWDEPIDYGTQAKAYA